ncbi:DUF2255 family protein [Microbacterium sp. ASV49]|uniref:DUF2255 family protein n=1 Tax=Microbacterium candidum TaxID=3041922 RepID=A0ABT7MU52_9MICO|nr:DUF2255 family protein [Microbacterium sp. ASV49]MDL9977958.1 DUF2255 family protein [Microbacterium sp. ASV49]
MTSWTAAELDAVGRAGELRVGGVRDDGTLRPLVIVWQVRVGDDLYLRSVRGPEGAWYRGVLRHLRGRIQSGGVTKDVRFARDTEHDDEVDAAYRAKYGTGSAVRSITSDLARQTTLRVTPA